MFDFCLVGNGLASILLATTLSQKGYRLAWLTRHKENQSIDENSCDFTSHLVLNHGSIRRLNPIIDSDFFDKEAHKLSSYCLATARRSLVTVKAQDLQLDFLGYQVPIRMLAQNLLGHIDWHNIQVIEANSPSSVVFDKPLITIKLSNTDAILAQYILLADGYHSPTRQLLESKEPTRFSQGHQAVVVHLEHEAGCFEHHSYQMIDSPYLIGVIANHSQQTTVVISAKDKAIKALLKSQNKLESYLRKVLPLSLRNFYTLRQNPQVQSIETYFLDNPLSEYAGCFGLVSNALHPAGALGFNHIISDVMLFNHFLAQQHWPIGRWSSQYNLLVKKRFYLANQTLSILTSPFSQRLLQSFPLPLEWLPRHLLNFAIA